MLKDYIRVFQDDDGTLIDQSLKLSEGGGLALDFVAADDFFYIGQYFPFNNFFIQAGTGNVSGCEISIDTWNGTSWCSGVDIIDGTSIGGATFAQSGVVQFEPDHDETWIRVGDTSREVGSGLESKKLYGLFWARVSLSANPSAGTNITRLGYGFCTNSQLKAINPDINEFLSSWQSGKTDWNEQIMLGSAQVVADLKQRGLVKSGAQILRFDDVSWAAAYKTLSMIFIPLGKAYEDKRRAYEKQYDLIMNAERFTFDVNNDGKTFPAEVQYSVGKGVR